MAVCYLSDEYQAIYHRFSAPLWDKFIEVRRVHKQALERMRLIIVGKARKNVPGTWDSLKDTLIGAHGTCVVSADIIYCHAYFVNSYSEVRGLRW